MSGSNRLCRKYLHKELGTRRSPPCLHDSIHPSHNALLTPSHLLPVVPSGSLGAKGHGEFCSGLSSVDEGEGGKHGRLQASPWTCDWFCCAESSSCHTQTALWLKSNEWLLDIWEITHKIQIDRIGCRVVITSSGGNTKLSIKMIFDGWSNTTCLPLDVAGRLNTTRGKTFLPGGNQDNTQSFGPEWTVQMRSSIFNYQVRLLERPHVTSQIQNPKKQTGGKCFRWSVIGIHSKSEEAENSSDQEVTNTDLTEEMWLSSFINKPWTHRGSHGPCVVSGQSSTKRSRWVTVMSDGPDPTFSAFVGWVGLVEVEIGYDYSKDIVLS